MNENQEAQALARWLEEHPGQSPPPDVDPEVMEALYALRPDLAPPPNLRIEDVFAVVESGPFATAKGDEEEMITEEVVSLAAERAKRVPTEVAPASPPLRHAPWWSRPGIGALAAAALALVVILPTAGILLTQKSADMEAAPPPASATVPAQEVRAKGGADAVATPTVEAAPSAQPDMSLHAEPPARRDANELLRQDAKKSDGMEEDRGRTGPLSAPSSRDFDAPADAAKPAATAPSADYRAAGSPQTEAVDDLEAQAVLEKTQPEAKMKAEEAAPAKELESSASAGAAAPSASSARSGSRSKDAAAPASPPMPPAEAPSVIADESSTPAAYAGISAASTDQALVAATDDSDNRKAMTAAWFLGRRQYDRGDRDAAIATIAKGLRRSGNDDLRSDLTTLQWTAQSTGATTTDQ